MKVLISVGLIMFLVIFFLALITNVFYLAFPDLTEEFEEKEKQLKEGKEPR